MRKGSQSIYRAHISNPQKEFSIHTTEASYFINIGFPKPNILKVYGNY